MDGDVPFISREGGEVLFAFIRHPADGAEDFRAEQYGSQFLKKYGPGMELERNIEAQTSTECDKDLQIGGPPQSGEVY